MLTILLNHGILLSKLPLEFLQKNNVQKIAQELLCKIIYVNINNHISSAIITETEAYQGPEDKASHAYKNKRTQRTEVMYKEGGCCYIYLCYGIHYLFNIVTSKKDIPLAVLIRSGLVHSGSEYIQKRRGPNIPFSKLLHGPGIFSKGLGINMALNGMQINNNSIWIEDNPNKYFLIESTQRVGIDYAEEDALLPWRYILKNCT